MILTQTKYRSTILQNNSIAQNALIVLLASVVLAVISQISIPWQPVPLTFQSAAVVLMGLTLGSKRAAAAVALYLLEGVCGLPVFAQGYAGAAVLMMSTGGYLIGFLPAAFLSGFLMEKGFAENTILTFAAALLSAAVIFLFGILHLQWMLGWHNAYLFGVKPFLITEPVKLLIAAGIAKFTWKKIA